MPPIKVLVVDDQADLRRAVVEVLAPWDDLEVVGQASNGAQAVELAEALLPHVIIMDLHMPGVDGLQATSVIHTRLPDIRVMVYTVSDSEEDLFVAMRCGARGYMLKNARASDLVAAVRNVAQGRVIVSPVMATKLLTDLARVPSKARQATTRPDDLNPMEVDVLKLVARGASDSEIAAALELIEGTVKTHLSNIMDKLHLANRSEAAVYAWNSGLQRPMER